MCIIYGETESPHEGACLRCDEPPVFLAIAFAIGGAAPSPTAALFLSPVVNVF